MFETFSPETRDAYDAALDEAHRWGSRRVGTEHLLLGLLNAPDESSARALEVDLEQARAALHRLNREALAAIGVDVDGFWGSPPPAPPTPKRLPLTAAAKNILATARGLAAPSSRYITTRHCLEALLEREQPDPAAALLAELGVDRDRVRERLAASGS